MTVTVLNTIHGLRVFDIIYSLTGGLTEVINTQVFKEFGMGRYGMANALNVVIPDDSHHSSRAPESAERKGEK